MPEEVHGMRTHWIRRHKVYRHQRADHNGIMWITVLVVVVITGLLLWRYHAI
jgi:hypothetical protein